ncbi:MAG: acyl-CoA dehydrogenase C-terminal domain-containing protein [Desulfatitalea sp.]
MALAKFHGFVIGNECNHPIDQGPLLFDHRRGLDRGQVRRKVRWHPTALSDRRLLPLHQPGHSILLETARYFFHYELPKSMGLAKRLADRDTLTLEMRNDYFAD